MNGAASGPPRGEGAAPPATGERARDEDPPPFLSWPRLYAIVIAALAACIAALAWLTASFR